jgi:DNA repair protein RadC
MLVATSAGTYAEYSRSEFRVPSSQMKHLAPHDRPREKLERHGPAALGDNELLAVILGSGSRDAGALQLANALLARADGLVGLTRTTVLELQQLEGIGPARAAQVLAAVELGRRTLLRGTEERPRLMTPDDIAQHLLPQYGASPVEQFGVLLLDTKNHVMRTRIISIGSLDQTIVHPREVFREATVASAAAVVLFHNHPSGDPSPSPDDLDLTYRVVAAGEILGIDVLDHLILADHRYFSMRESRVLPLTRRRSR